MMMLEKLARVLEPQAWKDKTGSLAYENRRKSSLRKARAAVAAMREAGTLHYVEAGVECVNSPAISSLDTAGNVWRSMIDSILHEEEKP